jgi:prevent-host-death family protein
MKVASLADVKARLSAYIEELPSRGPVVITRNGRTAAVLIAPEDDEDLERLLLARSPRFQALLNKSRRSIRDGKGLSRDQFWKAVKERNRK